MDAGMMSWFAGVLPPGAGQYLVWIVRALLPVIFFFICFRPQSQKGGWWTGSSGRTVDKEQFLVARQAVENEPVPSALVTLRLVDEVSMPSLFPKRAPRADTKAAADKRGDKKGLREKKRPKDEDEAVDMTEAQAQIAEEERMYIESLLNYMAFNRREMQRVFLPGTKPPPPPRLPQPPSEPLEATSPEAIKANSEAQMVLKGALCPKLDILHSDVAKDLHQHLNESHVEISETTFALMVEVCIKAEDLKGASDFLLKMESSGHSPDVKLLDKVMDLFSRRKAEGEEAAASSSPSGGAAPKAASLSLQPAADPPPDKNRERLRVAAPQNDDLGEQEEKEEKLKDEPQGAANLNFGAYFDEEDDS